MLDVSDAMEGVSVSQDVKTLVPMSLSLVAKKEKILQMEAAKLGKLLSQRNDMLCGLRESHEYLLTINGQLQERSRLRREKLVSLRTLLEADQEKVAADKPGVCDAIGVNELDATAEKCSVLKDILIGLADKHAALEQDCMTLEERTALDTETLRVEEEHLNEVRGTLLLLHEDIRSTQWNFENDQAELFEEDKKLSTISQSAQREAVHLEKISTALQTEKLAVADLQTIWQNSRAMVHEEHLQLAVANERAKSEQRELHKFLESNGATCSADEEVLEAAKDLQTRLQHLNEEITTAKFFKRELALRKKQEKDMLAIAQSSIKAKGEQLSWLERQRVHLEHERNEASKTQAANEAAHQKLLEGHAQAMSALEDQIKDAGKQMKAVERAITARNKKLSSINKKVAQTTKVLAEWNGRVDAKREDVAKAAATQELVDAELLSVQESLDQELRHLEHSQQLQAAQEMEMEELCSSCTELDTETRRLRKIVATMKNNITATQTAVKNRIDEIREKYLSSFVVEDAEKLIDLLNREIDGWTTRDAGKVDSAIASKGKILKERYDALAGDTHSKYGKVLRQKEKQYKAKLAKLRALEAGIKAKNASSVRARGEENILPASATRLKAGENKENMEPEQSSEVESQQFDPIWPQRPIGEQEKAPVANRQHLSKKPTQQKAKLVPKLVVPKKAPRSARRQLAPELNLADDSPRTDNEILDIFTVDTSTAASSTFSKRSSLNSGSKTRRTRLKRRTPAQKAGISSAAAKSHPNAVKAASVTPEAPAPVIVAAPSTQPNPADEKMPSYGSLGSPVGCEDNFDAAMDGSNAKTISGTEASSFSSQVPAMEQQLRKVDQLSNDVAKHRTSTKVSHRRHAKPAKIGRLSLARSQGGDWSAVDSFSFN